MKRALAIAAASGLLAFGLAPAAHAGEITGGKDPHRTPVKTGDTNASLCAFSGLDDVDEDENPDDPRTDDFGRTQNFGQIARFVKHMGGGPGRTCTVKVGAEEPPL